jgi:hypothetical protein
MDNLAQILPWWLLGAPLLIGVLDWMRTPRSGADRHHSTMAAADLPRR